MRVLHISHRYGRVGHAVVDNGVHRDSDAVLCQHLVREAPMKSKGMKQRISMRSMQNEDAEGEREGGRASEYLEICSRSQWIDNTACDAARQFLTIEATDSELKTAKNEEREAASSTPTAPASFSSHTDWCNLALMLIAEAVRLAFVGFSFWQRRRRTGKKSSPIKTRFIDAFALKLLPVNLGRTPRGRKVIISSSL